jgi:D-3-phosphoglycerate dehydrogenase / 2-oxoglutarate reductase
VVKGQQTTFSPQDRRLSEIIISYLWISYESGGLLKVLLLENISAVAVEGFREAGYQVESHKTALDERELFEKVKDVSVLGVRSKTRVTAAVLQGASRLVAVGAFCIGVDKIDQKTASERGIAIFNDPHSNSRSVAELVMGEIIMLLRRTFQASSEMHRGVWNKSAAGAHEVRGLTLGIVGYGKIGSQLSDLAEAMGMRVVFYDTSHVLARGNARPVGFRELLEISDVVTLHVDGNKENQDLFGDQEFRAMKDGACFLNLSRGFVVDHDALADHLKTGKLSGAAIDVFPKEPESGAGFESALRALPNVILTPHVGGSTEEAQANIGSFVSAKLLDYVRTGDSLLSVNLPQCHLEYEEGSYRLMHIHQNVPGILRAINDILADREINIERQALNTRGTLGYAIYDINRACDQELMAQLKAVPHTIAVRAKGC